MNVLDSGLPLGRIAGIPVRVHLTFVLFAVWRIQSGDAPLFSLLVVLGIYGGILLHELGHALAARWCDGEVDSILLWPLGGLAACRPAWHPTAHLLTTIAGPLVSLTLWLALWGVDRRMAVLPWEVQNVPAVQWGHAWVRVLAQWNRTVLLFNLIPAFPMDGGRILRDLLWRWLGPTRATSVAIQVSRIVALLGIGWALWRSDLWLIVLAAFILLQSRSAQQIVAAEAGAGADFSFRERWQRGRRRHAFRASIRAAQTETQEEAFHRCTICGRTERDSPLLDFRVCPDCPHGEEYCSEHLTTHAHAGGFASRHVEEQSPP